jgi:thioredoxin-like negative regulator of GroEL
MAVPSPPAVPAPEPAVLLVLLPPASPAALTSMLRQLQGRLGAQIQVLRIDEATHPAVVRSFGTPALPACVLLRQGVELWRHQGLPDDAGTLGTLLEALR